MTEQQKHNIASVLRMLAKKGTYDVFLQIKDQGVMHYNDVLKYALDAHIIKSRASVTTILNDLTDYGLLERTVVHTRPARTQYSVNEMGSKMLKHLEEIGKMINKN